MTGGRVTVKDLADLLDATGGRIARYVVRDADGTPASAVILVRGAGAIADVLALLDRVEGVVRRNQT